MSNCQEYQIECQKCHKQVPTCKTYDYKGVLFCEDCYQEGAELIDKLIQENNDEIKNKHVNLPAMTFWSTKEKNKLLKIFKEQLKISGTETSIDKKLRNGEL